MHIYTITNLVNKKQYVGQTINEDVRYRWWYHLHHLRKNTHKNLYLQRSFNKYGEQNFLFEVIDFAQTDDELNQKEALWVKQLNTLSPSGYNLKAGGIGGGHWDDETRKKLSISKLGNKNPRFGIPMSAEQKEKLTNINSKIYYFYTPEGNKLEIKNLSKFCRENGLRNDKMDLINRGKKKTYKGWKSAKEEIIQYWNDKKNQKRKSSSRIN